MREDAGNLLAGLLPRSHRLRRSWRDLYLAPGVAPLWGLRGLWVAGFPRFRGGPSTRESESSERAETDEETMNESGLTLFCAVPRIAQREERVRGWCATGLARMLLFLGDPLVCSVEAVRGQTMATK